MKVLSGHDQLSGQLAVTSPLALASTKCITFEIKGLNSENCICFVVVAVTDQNLRWNSEDSAIKLEVNAH